jgi:hypothetical protein
MLLWMLITIRIVTFYIPAHYALVYVFPAETMSRDINFSSAPSNSAGARV